MTRIPIDTLPTGDALDGTERVPLEQGPEGSGQTIQALLSEVVALAGTIIPPGSIPGDAIEDHTITDLQLALEAVTNAILAKMPAHTFKGNNTAALGAALDLTVSQMRAELIAQMAAHTFKGNNTGSVGNALDLTVVQMRAELLPADEASGHIEIPIAKVYVLSEYAMAAGTINLLKAKLSAGTCTVAIKINGTVVTGISAVSVTTSQSTGTASAANTFAIGARITLEVSSPSSAADLSFSVGVTLT